MSAENNNGKSTRKRVLVLLKLAASVGLIWLALKDVDGAEAWALASSLHWAAIIGALTALALKTLAGGARWLGVLRTLGGQLGFTRALGIFMLGLFFNQTLPSTIGGDAVRIWRAKADGVPLGMSTKSVLIERLSGFISLLGLVMFAAPFMYAWTGNATMAWTLGAIGLGGLIFMGSLAHIGRIKSKGKRRVTRALMGVATDYRTVFTDKKAAPRVISLSFFMQAMQVMTVFALARGIGVDLSLLQAFVLIPTVLLLSTLPISVAGWGVREVSMVTALSYAGVPAEEAVVVSILFGLSLILWGIISGGAWLLMRRTEILEAPAQVDTVSPDPRRAQPQRPRADELPLRAMSGDR